MSRPMREWLAAGAGGAGSVAVVGAPIARASISPSQAWATPPAFRAALARFPTWDAALDVDVDDLPVRDAGDVEGDRDDTDAQAAHARIEDAVATLVADATVVVIGGDNSLTRPAFRGAQRGLPGAWGLLTLDAHHDCRPVTAGSANGTPVRELIEAGLPGSRVAQVGIHPQGNARDHARWAVDQGIHVSTVDDVARDGIEAAVHAALAALHAAGAERVYADIDVDVVDRAHAPACPASLPGGITPAQLLAAARLIGREPSVRAADLCEVDATVDVAGITVRLMAAAFTAFCAGVAARSRT